MSSFVNSLALACRRLFWALAFLRRVLALTFLLISFALAFLYLVLRFGMAPGCGLCLIPD